MIDPKIVRNNPEILVDSFERRNKKFDMTRLSELDSARRDIMSKSEALKAERNETSKMIASKQRVKEDASADIQRMRAVGDEIKGLDAELLVIEDEFNGILMSIPNIPDSSVTLGESEEDNVEVKVVGSKPEFSFAPKGHWEIGESLGIYDPTAAARIAGSRFTLFKGLGAKLSRALIAFMLDEHTSNEGYTEIAPPAIVSPDSLLASGQLPKFEEDLFGLREGMYMSPTAECQLTNLHRDDIIAPDMLPLAYTAHTPCFRAEAGSAGQESRGLIRQHQFDKVEMYKFVLPENSMDELEIMLKDAVNILEKLGLCYRVLELCTGDLGFAAVKTYDLEVWMPGMNKFVEISSCSNCGDFQARRGQIRFRRNSEAKPELCHTLNGSGLAVGRTIAAIFENYQQEDGTLIIPEVLRKYMGVEVIS